MRFSVFAGDIADAEADALCTSTNPRLSLMMGTGASVRARGGFAVLRACEAIVGEERRRSGRFLPAGSVHVTTAGELPQRLIIHCVASDGAHRSSTEIVAACVRNAALLAVAAGCRSVAMPVFATGHARVPFARAVRIMAEELRTVAPQLDVVFVVNDVERAEEAQAILGPGVSLTISEKLAATAAASAWANIEE